MRRFFDVLVAASGTGSIDRQRFEGYLKSINISRDERKQWFSIIDVGQDGLVKIIMNKF